MVTIYKPSQVPTAGIEPGLALVRARSVTGTVIVCELTDRRGTIHFVIKPHFAIKFHLFSLAFLFYAKGYFPKTSVVINVLVFITKHVVARTDPKQFVPNHSIQGHKKQNWVIKKNEAQ